MSWSSAHRLLRRSVLPMLAVALLPLQALAVPQTLSILHVGDQESWLLSAQGNLRDNASQAASFYGGIDRLAAVIAREEALALSEGRFVLKLNAGDAFLPGPRFTASFANLGGAFTDGGQDFYDAIAMRQMLIFDNMDEALTAMAFCFLGAMVLFAIGVLAFHFKRLRSG